MSTFRRLREFSAWIRPFDFARGAKHESASGDNNLRKLIAAIATLSFMSAAAAAPSPKSRILYLHPDDPAISAAILIPAGSPVRLVSFKRGDDNLAVFRGSFTLSGTYKLEEYEGGLTASLWPDSKSVRLLPYWKQRGHPDGITITNEWAFARAVVTKDELKKLKASMLKPTRGNVTELMSGRVTIVADDYSTYMECDGAHYSMRFVSLVKVASSASETGEIDC